MASPPADEPLLSVRSGRVRAARRLARRSSRDEFGLFLAEGPQAVREALAIEGCVREVFARPAAHPELAEQARVAQIRWYDAEEAAIAALSDTVTPQGVVAVCEKLDVELDALVEQQPRLVAVCADLRDPGNVGTVIRCADAAGADAVVVAGASVDLYNSKVVRASAGSVFHLPIVVVPDSAAVVHGLRAAGLTVLATTGVGESDLDDLIDESGLAGPTAWLFGNEAQGLPTALSDLADRRVRIPLHGRAESLNVSTAAAVCLYASARAHRARPVTA